MTRWSRLLIYPLLATIVLAACQSGQQPRPVPSVNQIGSDLKCPVGDHGYADPAGWGFCYPGSWKYNLRAQPSVDLRGLQELDLTFDITDVPCVTPSVPAGQPTPRPICSPGAGEFAYMIISTYQRGGSPDLGTWVLTDVKPSPSTSPITWGNAVEAARLADGRRVALTPSQVVILDLRSGSGNLDLEAAMSSRLATWKFYF